MGDSRRSDTAFAENDAVVSGYGDTWPNVCPSSAIQGLVALYGYLGSPKPFLA
jgi:hypothetical protein